MKNMLEDKYKIEDIENIELIKWAFETGYRLGNNDGKEGIHIDFTETQKHFLTELSKFNHQKLRLSFVSA